MAVRLPGHSETQLLVMVSNHTVLDRRNVDSDEPLYTLCHRGPRDLAQHGLLDLSPQDPATHQPGVNVPVTTVVVLIGGADHHADHPQITELILQPDL